MPDDRPPLAGWPALGLWQLALAWRLAGRR
jgi:hypothetical protein